MTHIIDRRRVLLAGAALAATRLIGLRAARAVTPAEIKAKGKVTIGIQGDNPPWGYVDTSGKVDGLDFDIGTLFAKELGVTAEFTPLAVANRIPALTTGRVDVLFATMAMLPDRAKAVQFSKPYIGNITYVVAAKGTAIKSYADLGKLTVGAPRSSSQDNDITKNAPQGTTIRRFDDDAATIQALLSGQVDAIGGNMFYVARLSQTKPGAYENKFALTTLYNGACTRLGEKEINAALNSFIDKIKGNGDLTKVAQKWMNANPPEFPASLPDISFVAS